MNFVKSETLYLSENEHDIIRKAMELFETIEDNASSPEIRNAASNVSSALYSFYENEFVQHAENDPDFWMQSTESEEYARDEDKDNNPWRFCMETEVNFPPQKDEMATNGR